MVQPPRIFADILEQEINPNCLQISGFLKECLGQAASEDLVQYCHTRIMRWYFQLLQLKHNY
jgi:hypothetical protein